MVTENEQWESFQLLDWPHHGNEPASQLETTVKHHATEQTTVHQWHNMTKHCVWHAIQESMLDYNHASNIHEGTIWAQNQWKTMLIVQQQTHEIATWIVHHKMHVVATSINHYASKCHWHWQKGENSEPIVNERNHCIGKWQCAHPTEITFTIVR